MNIFKFAQARELTQDHFYLFSLTLLLSYIKNLIMTPTINDSQRNPTQHKRLL